MQSRLILRSDYIHHYGESAFGTSSTLAKDSADTCVESPNCETDIADLIEPYSSSMHRALIVERVFAETFQPYDEECQSLLSEEHKEALVAVMKTKLSQRSRRRNNHMSSSSSTTTTAPPPTFHQSPTISRSKIHKRLFYFPPSAPFDCDFINGKAKLRQTVSFLPPPPPLLVLPTVMDASTNTSTTTIQDSDKNSAHLILSRLAWQAKLLSLYMHTQSPCVATTIGQDAAIVITNLVQKLKSSLTSGQLSSTCSIDTLSSVTSTASQYECPNQVPKITISALNGPDKPLNSPLSSLESTSKTWSFFHAQSPNTNRLSPPAPKHQSKAIVPSIIIAPPISPSKSDLHHFLDSMLQDICDEMNTMNESSPMVSMTNDDDILPYSPSRLIKRKLSSFQDQSGYFDGNKTKEYESPTKFDFNINFVEIENKATIKEESSMDVVEMNSVVDLELGLPERFVSVLTLHSIMNTDKNSSAMNSPLCSEDSDFDFVQLEEAAE